MGNAVVFTVERVSNGFILYERASYSTSNGDVLGVAITADDLGQLVASQFEEAKTDCPALAVEDEPAPIRSVI